MERLDLLGAWVAAAIFILSSLVFISRLAEKPNLLRLDVMQEGADEPRLIEGIKHLISE